MLPPSMFRLIACLWATSHPGQHVVNHSIRLGKSKRILLWEVQSNVVGMFVTMNREVQKYHGNSVSVHLFLLSRRLLLNCG